MTLPGKPWVYGEKDSHLFYRYLYRHYHYHTVHLGTPSLLSVRLRPVWYAPLPLKKFQGIISIRNFGTGLESR